MHSTTGLGREERCASSVPHKPILESDPRQVANAEGQILRKQTLALLERLSPAIPLESRSEADPTLFRTGQWYWPSAFFAKFSGMTSFRLSASPVTGCRLNFWM